MSGDDRRDACLCATRDGLVTSLDPKCQAHTLGAPLSRFDAKPEEPSGKNHCAGDDCEKDCEADDRCGCGCSRCGPWNAYRDDLEAWERRSKATPPKDRAWTPDEQRSVYGSKATPPACEECGKALVPMLDPGLSGLSKRDFWPCDHANNGARPPYDPELHEAFVDLVDEYARECGGITTLDQVSATVRSSHFHQIEAAAERMVKGVRGRPDATPAGLPDAPSCPQCKRLLEYIGKDRWQCSGSECSFYRRHVGAFSHDDGCTRRGRDKWKCCDYGCELVYCAKHARADAASSSDKATTEPVYAEGEGGSDV